MVGLERQCGDVYLCLRIDATLPATIDYNSSYYYYLKTVPFNPSRW